MMLRSLGNNRASNLLIGAPGPHILPSLLECDYVRLAEVMAQAEAAGVRMFHLDVMDGHFVPNLSYGPPVVRSMRQATRLPLDAHLMISNPEKYVDEFCQAGCDIVTIHLEATAEPRPLLARIRQKGALAGIALNPPMPVERLAPFLDDIDLVLVMSVMPGFSGQKFQPEVLQKFRWLREHGPRRLLLEGDGGLNRETIPTVSQAGVDLLVVGSALFRTPDFKSEFQLLQSLASANPATYV